MTGIRWAIAIVAAFVAGYLIGADRTAAALWWTRGVGDRS